MINLPDKLILEGYRTKENIDYVNDSCRITMELVITLTPSQVMLYTKFEDRDYWRDPVELRFNRTDPLKEEA